MGGDQSEKRIVLDPITEAAVIKGLEIAESNPKRWTQEEVRVDTIKLGRKWLKECTVSL